MSALGPVLGQVVHAVDTVTSLSVAVKIIKNQKHFHEQARPTLSLPCTVFYVLSTVAPTSHYYVLCTIRSFHD